LQASLGLLQQELFYFIAHETTSAMNKCCNNLNETFIQLQLLFYFIARKNKTAIK